MSYLRIVLNSGLLWLLFLAPVAVPQQAMAQPAFLLQDSTQLQQPAAPISQAMHPVTRSKALQSASIALSGAALWTLSYAYVDEPFEQFVQSHRSAVADGISLVVQPLGRQKYLLPVAGAAFVTGLIAKDKKLQQAGVISMGSIIINSAVTSTLKNTFHRYRPSTTTENHEYDEPFCGSLNGSLPSSHTSTAFTVATSIATVYKDKKYVPPIAYGVATLVGLSRINDNAHWTTDVLAGAAVGYLSSKGVSLLYDLADKKLKSRQLLITPQLSANTGGLSATYVF
ncbi:phosphatase PAP2 family protein [Pontibacter sp. MBLB2868]|uniref:phosphatase PAP2 family protein n=1 Tax=Pontibacter sp. MBLB2868 TaxID=3451555 RepID=UPI003F756A9C